MAGIIEQGKQRRVLVLGGTGFLGTQIARAFRRSGCSVVVVTRSAPVHREHDDPTEYIVGDALDEDVLARALMGVGHVVHALGGLSPVEAQGDTGEALARTVRSLAVLLDQLRRRPGVGLTYLSSGGAVYGNADSLPVSESQVCSPISAYGILKLTAEHYVSMYADVHGVPARVLRIANAYGPGQSAAKGQGLIAALLDAASTSSPIRIFGNGQTIRDYVHVRDVADAVVALSRRSDGPRVVNIGSGVGHSVNDVLAIVDAVTGTAQTITWEHARGFDVGKIYLDVSVLRSLVPWSPVRLRDGIAEAWQEWRRPPATILRTATA